MAVTEFDWDADKAERNVRRHGVDFIEAASAFNDGLAYIVEDETHSFDEPRELLVGHSRRNRLLLVVFTERDANRIRIISARLANGKERKRYEHEKRF
jgi:uncharacterized protein